MQNVFSPGIQQVADAAARQGVALNFQPLPAARLSTAEIASVVNADLGQIVKSIVCMAPRPGGFAIPFVCLISGRNRLDLDLLVGVTGEPRVREATAAETKALLGYPEGSVPPFGHGHDVKTVMDQSLGGYPWIWASAGIDTAVFRIAPAALRSLANAVVAPVAQPSWLRPIGARGAIRLRSPIRVKRGGRPPRPRGGVEP